MIDPGTLSRIERVKLLLRDERRAALVRAEADVIQAEGALSSRRADEERAGVAFRGASTLAPAELELVAGLLVEARVATARAAEVVDHTDRLRAVARDARIEAERELRGLGLARERVERAIEAERERRDTALVELRAGRPR